MTRQPAYAIVFVAAVLAAGRTPARAACPKNCPQDECLALPGPEIGFILTPSTLSMPQQCQNPLGSETWTAGQWAIHLNVGLTFEDVDTIVHRHFVKGDCDCVDEETVSSRVDNYPRVTWTFGGGKRTDLTTPGTYVLHASINEPTELPGNCTTFGDDESIEVDFILTVTPGDPGDCGGPPPPESSSFAARSSGAAPLAVFFDAIKTASPPWDPKVAQPGSGEDFAAYHYAWNFGDASSGTWSTSGRSKNTAVGHIAAHVFENPGVYTVRLTITSPSGNVQEYSQDISVQAFSGTTYYVSSSGGSDANDGLSMSAPLASLSAGMSKLGANKRLLLKRGDTWTISSDLIASVPGPVMVGAYDTGARPVITMTTDENIFTMLNAATDWRFVDLDLRKPNATTIDGAGILAAKTDCLALRCRFEGFSTGFAHYANTASHTFGLVDCEFTGQYANNIYVAPNGTSPPCTRLFILGCSLGHTHNQHLVRVHTDKTLIAHNTFQQCPSFVHHLKLAAAPQQLPGYPYRNHYSLVSDNRFINPGGSAWILSVGPQDSGTEALVEHIVLERNLFDVPGKVALESRGANWVTVRNNVFRNCREAISIGDGVPNLSRWSDWGIYNNTYWTSAQEGVFLNLAAQPVNWRVRNNICDIPNAFEESYAVWTNVPGFSLLGLNCNQNLYNIPNRQYWFAIPTLYTFIEWRQIGQDGNGITGPPGFVSPYAGDYQLTATSIAADKGASLPQVREDFTGAARPRGPAYDIGAYER